MGNLSCQGFNQSTNVFLYRFEDDNKLSIDLKVSPTATKSQISIAAQNQGLDGGTAASISKKILEDVRVRWSKFQGSSSKALQHGFKKPSHQQTDAAVKDPASMPKFDPKLAAKAKGVFKAPSLKVSDDASAQKLSEHDKAAKYKDGLDVATLEDIKALGRWNSQMGDIAPVLMANMLDRPIHITLGNTVVRIDHDIAGAPLNGPCIHLMNSGNHYYIQTDEGPISMPTDGDCFYHAISVCDLQSRSVQELRTQLSAHAASLDAAQLGGFLCVNRDEDGGSKQLKNNSVVDLATHLDMPIWILDEKLNLEAVVDTRNDLKTPEGPIAMVVAKGDQFHALVVGKEGRVVDATGFDTVGEAAERAVVLGAKQAASDKDDVKAAFLKASQKLLAQEKPKQPAVQKGDIAHVPMSKQAPEKLSLVRKMKSKSEQQAFLFADTEKAQILKLFDKGGKYGLRKLKPKDGKKSVKVYEPKLAQEQLALTRIGFNDIDREDKKFLAENVALFPGHFAPPHKGHYGVVKASLAAGCGAVLVTLNRHKLNHLIDEDIAIRMWDLYLRADGFKPEPVGASGNLGASTPKSGQTLRQYTNTDGKVVFLGLRIREKDVGVLKTPDERAREDAARVGKAYDKFEAHLNRKRGLDEHIKLDPNNLVRLCGRDVFEKEGGPNMTLTGQVDNPKHDPTKHTYGDNKQVRGVPLRLVMNRPVGNDTSATKMDGGMDKLFDVNDAGKATLQASNEQVLQFCADFLPPHLVEKYGSEDNLATLRDIITDIAQRREDIRRAHARVEYKNKPKSAVDGKILPVAEELHIPHSNLLQILAGDRPFADFDGFE